MPKLHLKCSDTPIQLGKDTVADCGETVKDAVAAFLADYKSIDELFRDWTPPGTCWECRKTHEYQTRRYVYGIVNGEESIRQESRDAGS